MTDYALPKDASELGLRYRDTESVTIDWGDLSTELEGEDYVVFPKPTASVLEEYGLGDGRDLSDPDVLEEAIEEFRQTDEYYEWRDANSPKMNYLWPVEPMYNSSLEQAAQLIEEHGGSTCLVHFERNGEKVTGIALTGGGMNLSHDLAAAYVCCGHAPPTTLMHNALSQIEMMAPAARPLVIGAADKLAASLRHSADDLEDAAARVRAKLAPSEDGPSGPRA